jgi:hypothetical protein
MRTAREENPHVKYTKENPNVLCIGCFRQIQKVVLGHAINLGPRAIPLVLILLDHQLVDFYYCISILKIVRAVSYRLYSIMRYLW